MSVDGQGDAANTSNHSRRNFPTVSELTARELKDFEIYLNAIPEVLRYGTKCYLESKIRMKWWNYTDYRSVTATNAVLTDKWALLQKEQNRIKQIESFTYFQWAIEMFEKIYIPDHEFRETLTRVERWHEILKSNCRSVKLLRERIHYYGDGIITKKNFPNHLNDAFNNCSVAITDYFCQKYYLSSELKRKLPNNWFHLDQDMAQLAKRIMLIHVRLYDVPEEYEEDSADVYSPSQHTRSNRSGSHSRTSSRRKRKSRLNSSRSHSRTSSRRKKKSRSNFKLVGHKR